MLVARQRPVVALLLRRIALGLCRSFHQSRRWGPHERACLARAANQRDRATIHITAIADNNDLKLITIWLFTGRI